MHASRRHRGGGHAVPCMQYLGRTQAANATSRSCTPTACVRDIASCLPSAAGRRAQAWHHGPRSCLRMARVSAWARLSAHAGKQGLRGGGHTQLVWFAQVLILTAGRHAGPENAIQVRKIQALHAQAREEEPSIRVSAPKAVARGREDGGWLVVLHDGAGLAPVCHAALALAFRSSNSSSCCCRLRLSQWSNTWPCPASRAASRTRANAPASIITRQRHRATAARGQEPLSC